ncbi:GGDEF domain-containing protein [Streptomyces sp. NPDC093990]|uniref:GGDEF domain-containing protein n=1 Tax=Streptomyces sp. NPDC093990 TaxID=3155306 RepID=UPI00342959C0
MSGRESFGTSYELDLGGRAGRHPAQVTLDVGPPYTRVPHRALLDARAGLRGQGFRISADGVGDGDAALRLLVDMSPDLVKLDASLLARPAAVRAMRTLCDEFGALLGVEGVETELQYGAALSAGASAGQVRALPTGSPDVSGALLVDRDGVPFRSVHRSRFLPSMSGRHGHALYAERPAAGLGDPPRTVGIDATAWEVLDVVAAGDRDRTSDEATVVDRYGRCVGVVRLADLVRALSETRVEEAAGLNPLTRLPGSDAITDEMDRRIADGRTVTLSRLDSDHFKQVNDVAAGFEAGDELIREVGRLLQDSAAGTACVGHIGGDDFLVLTDAEELAPLAASVLDAPWAAGGRPVALSLATVVCLPGSVADHREAALCLAPSKKAAKALGGASWVVRRAGLPGHEIGRGTAARTASKGYTVAEPGRGRAASGAAPYGSGRGREGLRLPRGRRPTRFEGPSQPVRSATLTLPWAR